MLQSNNDNIEQKIDDLMDVTNGFLFEEDLQQLKDNNNSNTMDINDGSSDDMAGGFIRDNDTQNVNNNTLDVDNIDDMSGGFLVDTDNHSNGVVSDIRINSEKRQNQKQKQKKKKKRSDKEEADMTSDEDEDESDCVIVADNDDDDAIRPLCSNMDDNNSNESDIELCNDLDAQIDDHLYARIQEANPDKFYKFPRNIAKLTAADIAGLPASMQYEIMQKRRELLRNTTRSKFFDAAGNPEQYAAVQLKTFLKTSSLNSNIEKIRKELTEQYHKQMLIDNDNNNGNANNSTNNNRIQRIASEANRVYILNEENPNPNLNQNPNPNPNQLQSGSMNSNNRFSYQWMSNYEKARKRRYMNNKRNKYKKRRGKYNIDYVAKTLEIDSSKNKNMFIGKTVSSSIVFEYWNCPKCKYLNLKQRSKCDICGIIRDDALKKWECCVCKHINDGKQKLCLLCDNPNIYDIDVNGKQSMNNALMLYDNNHVNDDDIDGCNDIDVDNDNDNDDGWICNVCNWQNSDISNNCSSCDNPKSKRNTMDNDNDNQTDVDGLQLILDEPDVLDVNSDTSVSIPALSVNQTDILSMDDDSDSDNDLLLKAPTIMMDLNGLQPKTPTPSPSKGNAKDFSDKSPTRSASKLQELASSNVKALLNVKNSLTNFYNIARLTQQSSAFDEINTELKDNNDINDDIDIDVIHNHNNNNDNNDNISVISTINDNDDDDDDGTDIEICPNESDQLVEPLLIENDLNNDINDKHDGNHIVVASTIQDLTIEDDEDEDDTDIEICQDDTNQMILPLSIQNDSDKSDINDNNNSEYSEHESDDDIIQEMDITPGNIDNILPITQIFTSQSQTQTQTTKSLIATQKIPTQLQSQPNTPLVQTQTKESLIATQQFPTQSQSEPNSNTCTQLLQTQKFPSRSPTPLPITQDLASQTQNDDNIQSNIEQDDNGDMQSNSFIFDIPTFEEVEEAEKIELAQFERKQRTPNKNQNQNQNPLVILSDHDEEDEKLMVISDPHLMSKSLAEINANQKQQQQMFLNQLDVDNDNNNSNKPLQRRSKKRKLNDNNDLSPNPKKRRLNNDNNNNIVSIDRNIGMNDGEISNSLRKLHNIEDSLMEENILLHSQQATAVRNSEHVTLSMIDECRHLLDLFGVPYITSPSEAEAQCAELNSLGLVDGIITDDCDVFLFGGNIIYKNLFHLNKYVEKYSLSLINTKLGLTRNKLICCAMLLGSDYTDGIKNIGIVNCCEIIQTFCNNPDNSDFDGLIDFKKWIYSGTNDKQPDKIPNVSNQTINEYIKYKNELFKYKHRNIKKHWFVSHNFPNSNVIETYLKPNVDKSNDKFEWGKPNIQELKVFCQTKFKWDKYTIDSTLDPINKIAQNGRGRLIQSHITSFVDWQQPNKNIKSKRIQNAVNSMIKELEFIKQKQKELQNDVQS